MRVTWVGGGGFGKYAGIDNLAILNGGYENWLRRGKSVSRDRIVPKASTYAPEWRRNLVVNKDYVFSMIGKAAIVDTRPARIFSGEVKAPSTGKAGHIPSAVNLPYSLIFSKSGLFKSYEELYSLASSKIGSDKQKEVIVLCCDGRYASSWWFVFSEILAYKKVTIFDGAMEEWCKDPTLPLSLGPDK